MPCNPLDEADFDPGSSPGFNLGSVQLPTLDIPFPDLPLENLQSLFDSLGMILPPGIMKPSFHPDVLNEVYAGIMDLLNKFFPFLMLYKFFLPVLNLILCIIEVLCAIPNPFKLIRTLRRLFRVCIPEFLALFPYFALILMIIALILLIIALIEYIITRLIQIIETILRNIILLSKSASSLNSDSIIAIVKKIGDLLCVLQNLFILFAIFNTILQIIKALAGLSFRIPPCDSSDGSDDGCCTPEVCPQFIRENETVVSSTGIFQYLGEIGINSGLTLPVGFPNFYSVIRPESWQFYDPSLAQSQQFINITHAWDLPTEFRDTVFFPAGASYDENTNYVGTPYYINFTVLYNPTVFGRTDLLGTRLVKIKNCIVQAPPTAGVSNYNGVLVAPLNGTLNLVGGVITEMDGTPILDPSTNNSYTIRRFFHQPTNNYGTTPNVSDPVLFTSVSYTLTINHPVLVSSGLITLGCVPSVAIERDWLSATLGDQFNANGARLAGITALLPDMAAAQQCVIDAITSYRRKISTASTNKFKSDVLGCLSGLRSSAVSALVETVSAGYDPYKSDFTVEPPIQFTTAPVVVTVLLRESSGTIMTTNLPKDIAAIIAAKITATNSFGEIGSFTYDGSQYFVAEITSKEAGNGEIKVAYENSIIGILNNSTDLNQTPSLALKTGKYTFVKSQVLHGGEGAPRRDDTDISGR
jgi:hypothetical protein